MMVWVQLLICLLTIGVAGWHLSKNGDIIAEKILGQHAALGDGLAQLCARVLGAFQRIAQIPQSHVLHSAQRGQFFELGA